MLSFPFSFSLSVSLFSHPLLLSSPPLLLSSLPTLLPFCSPALILPSPSHLPPLLHSFHQAEENSEMWKNYLEHIDMIVVDGFFNSIHCSLRYLLSNTDKEKCDLPFLECKLELQAPDMIFIPTLDQVHRTFEIWSYSDMVLLPYMLTTLIRMLYIVSFLGRHSVVLHRGLGKS